MTVGVADYSHRVSIMVEMAAKKKAAVPRRRKPKLTVRQKALAGGDAPSRKKVRTEEWPAEWVAVFAKFDGEPAKFAAAAELTYQTIWRLGIKGEAPGFESRVKIRQTCALHDLKSPV